MKYLHDVVELPAFHAAHTYHLFPVRVDADRRDKILDYMLAHDISVGVHYKPLTYYTPFEDQATPPVTECEWKRLISLPIFYDMTDDQVEYVIKCLKEAVNAA